MLTPDQKEAVIAYTRTWLQQWWKGLDFKDKADWRRTWSITPGYAPHVAFRAASRFLGLETINETARRMEFMDYFDAVIFPAVGFDGTNQA